MQKYRGDEVAFSCKNGTDEVAFSCSEGYNKFKLRIYYRYGM